MSFSNSFKGTLEGTLKGTFKGTLVWASGFVWTFGSMVPMVTLAETLQQPCTKP